MKIFQIRSLHVAITSAFSLLAAAIAIYGKELFRDPLTGMLIAAGASFALFALSISLHKKVILRDGAGQALAQLTMWLGLLLVILPNALVALQMALMLVIEPGSDGLLRYAVLILATVFFLFGPFYYLLPAEIFGDLLFSQEFLPSPLGFGGLLVSMVFYATVVMVTVFIIHAIASRRLDRKLTKSEWRLGFIGFAFAAVFLCIYLIWDPVQRDFRISRTISPESTQLLQASSLGDLDSVKELLAKDADIPARDEYGWDALYHAVYGTKVKTVKFLLEHGANPNTRENRKGFKCLDQDCTDTQEISGKPALECAIASGNEDIVQLLLAHGADTSFKNEAGMTPLALAADRDNIEMLQAFLDVGADPATDPEAVSRVAGLIECEPLRLLLDAGGNPDDGIHSAVLGLRIRCVKMLLEYGANPNARTHMGGMTPLMLSREPSIIQILLAAGADPSIPDENGLTALDHARQNGRKDLVTLMSGNK
jgi:ankyrin repeat protein